MKPQSRVTRREEFDDSLRKYAQQSSASAGSTVPEVPKVGAPVGAAAEVQPKKITIAPAPINQIPKAPKPPQMPIGTTASSNVDRGAPKSPKSSTTAQDLRLSMLRLMLMEKLFKSLFKARGEQSRNQGLKRHPSIAQTFDSLPIDRLVTRGPRVYRSTAKEDGHHGVFGENRGVYIQVAPSNDRGEIHEGVGPRYPYIDYLQLRPKAKVGPEHVQAFFDALHRQGYDGDTMHFYAMDDDDDRTDANGLNRRERLFRPIAAQWKKFVAAQQGKPAESAEPTAPTTPTAPAAPAAPAVSKSYKTPAWQRAEGQNPKGGLNAKGRASAKTEGHNLKPPVKSGDNPRRASFLARMGNSPGPEHDEHGKPTRLLLALQAWGASSKADARKKAKAISKRLQRKKVGKALVFRTSGYDDLLKGRGAEARSNPSSYGIEAGHSIHDPSMLGLKATHDSLEKFSSLLEDRPPKPFFGRFINAGENAHMGYFGPQGMISLTASPTEYDTDPDSPTKMKSKDMLTPGAPVAHPKILYLRIAHDAPEPVTDKHEQEIFHGLWDAGYRGRNMTYMTYPDVQSTASQYAGLRAARGQPPRPITAQRDRLFGLRKKRWASFVDDKNSEQNAKSMRSTTNAQPDVLRKGSQVAPVAAKTLMTGSEEKAANSLVRDASGRPTIKGISVQDISHVARVHGNVGKLFEAGILAPIPTHHATALDGQGNIVQDHSVDNQQTIAKVHGTTEVTPDPLAHLGVVHAGMVTTGGRPFVLVRHVEPNGEVHHLPFYQSTGGGDKEETTNGAWYYTPGFRNMSNDLGRGWIGKKNGKDMLETSEIPVIKYYKGILDTHLGNVLGIGNSIPKMFDGVSEYTPIEGRVKGGSLPTMTSSERIDPMMEYPDEQYTDPKSLGRTMSAITQMSSVAPSIKALTKKGKGGMSWLLQHMGDQLKGAHPSLLPYWEAQKEHLATLRPPSSEK